MKRFLLLSVSIIIALSTFADIPPNYYDTADGLTGESLKTALHNIIKDHTVKSYSDLWTILKETDEDPNNTDNFILIYTGRSIPKTSAYPDFNREHVWAKSHGFPNESDYGYTDAHHLRPSDVDVNSARGNLDFDNGGTLVSGTTDCYADGDSWEPRDEVKGDIARMMFYMVVRYEGDGGTNDDYDLELVDYVGTSGTEFGKLSTLIEWHNNDPVDAMDIQRNEVVYSYQGNRNPFIDHPEYVAAIWGGTGVYISSVAHTPTSPTSSDEVTVTADITSAGGNITSANLKWGTTSGNYSNTVSMSASGDTYSANIQAQANGTTVYYIIEAQDDNAESASSTEKSYTVNDGGGSSELLNEDFATCPATGWLAYSVAGSKNWECGTQYMQVNAYESDAACDDWLISPAQNLDLYENEILSFNSWTKFADAGYSGVNYPPIKIKYSTDYSGSGDPLSANWTELNATWPTENSETWTGSGDIDVSAISGSQVYFAFHYVSSGTGAGSSALWEIDDVVITGSEITNQTPVINNVANTPISPKDNESVTVSATVTDADGSISSVVLKWGTASGVYPNSVNMTNTGSNNYSGSIEAQSAGTNVYYVIEATDNEASKTTSNENTYLVSSSSNADPVISNVVYSPTNPESTESVSVSATISDADGSVSVAQIKWGTSAGNYTNTINMQGSGSSYSGTIPAQTNRTHVYFVVYAQDNESATAQSAEFDYTVSNSANPVISNVSIDPLNPTEDDNVIVAATVSDSDGSVATVVLAWKRGVSGTETNSNMNLSGGVYYGQIPKQATGETIYFTITATDNDDLTDSYDGNYDVSASNSIISLNDSELQIYPNPTRDKVYIRVQKSEHLKSIAVYNLIGEKIMETNQINSTEYYVELSDYPKGIYILQIEGERNSNVKKIILR